MKIYKYNKLYLVFGIMIAGTVIPGLVVFLIMKLFNAPISEFCTKPLLLLPWLLVQIILISEFFAKIEIDHHGISKVTVFAKMELKWGKLLNLEYKSKNKKITLHGENGEKLFLQNNIVNYKLLYRDIYEKIQLHKKESVIDKSFLKFIKS